MSRIGTMDDDERILVEKNRQSPSSNTPDLSSNWPPKEADVPPAHRHSIEMQQSSSHQMASYDENKGRPQYGYNDEEAGLGCCGCLLMGFSCFLIFIFFPFSMCACMKMVQEYERAVIFRLGRIKAGGAQGPGMFFIVPCLDDIQKVDLRTKTFNIPPQEILSKDTVTVTVDAVIYASVFDPVLSVCNVADSMHATTLLSATTLRNTLGTRTMAEMLQDRETIAQTMQHMLDEATNQWGIRVERVEIKDVRLPNMLQRAMAAEAEASRDAKAKVLAAEGEQMAARALKEAADIISSSPTALQLRYLQTLSSVAAERESTILFPIPIDLMKGMGGKGGAVRM
ncbi:band 7 protein AGAP004871-like isoform X2 [Pecten maximus]|uniref:band 7 protein AGAP004871-like isoform X2 n=1 Tax=Pecten maximus TaxID=6579 RepID=UPI001458A440|nr:band 7 protein AGAP004871-like isoform X2 [Pecten maximus]